MKSLKIFLLPLIGLLLVGSFGCGGGGSSSFDSGAAQESQSTEEIDASIAELIDTLLAADSDGVPAIFDYAPEFEALTANAATNSQEVDFVKYITSKDLDSNDEFVTTIRLNKDSAYIIKYSHAGRNLNNALLNLRITAPDNDELVLDLAQDGAPEISGDITSEEVQPYYVSTDFEIIPEENPCMILYGFQAPLTGNYEFAVSELTLVSGEGVVKNRSLDIPFEFRIYGAEDYYLPFDDEEFQLSSREIIELQRIIWDYATECNEYGMPVLLNDEGEVNISAVNNGLKDSLAKQLKTKSKIDSSQQVIPKAEISNVPYDVYYKLGEGFYAHSGLRAVMNVVDDKSFSRAAVSNFTALTPGTGNEQATNENFNFTVIATKEEHDRAMELDSTSNFALLRDALGESQREDYARLGGDHTKIISVRYELIESKPRLPDPKEFKLLDEALYILKQEGYQNFLNEFGDYFVSGYTWGTRYDATIEIVTVPGKSYFRHMKHFSSLNPIRINNSFLVMPLDNNPIRETNESATLCDVAAGHLKKLLKLVVDNAISERDTGKSISNKNEIQWELSTIQEDFHEMTIRVAHSRYTGRATDMSFSIGDFVKELENFIKSAKQTPRSQYQPLYTTFRRYREIEEARPYIPEALTVPKSRYNAIRQLTEKIFLTRCYYNALMAITQEHLRTGTTIQDQWKKEFEIDLVSKVKSAGMNYVCADESRIKDFQKQFNALYEKYKGLAERYNFYRYFTFVQKNTVSPSWDTSDEDNNRSWSRGFSTYDKSQIVKADMAAGQYLHHRHIEPWYKGDGYADFKDSFSDEYIYWYNTGYEKTNGCKGRDVNGQTIGKKSYNWHYDGAGGRRLEVFLYYKTIKMPDNLYPFVGLE
ncbi:MAG: hypothetical protein IJR94_07280 [Synergistaceae bacterium]|nr:hypothetical protein [Synergistaceae bacterium]